MFKKLFGKKNEGFYMQVEDDTPKAAKPVEKKAPAPKPVEEAAKPVAADAPAQVEAVAAPEKKEKKEKKSIKKEKAAKKEEKAATAPVAPAPVAAAAPEIPVVAPIATPRRRPGANMKAYLDLAKQVQIPMSAKK